LPIQFNKSYFGLTTVIYDAPTIKALKFLDHDLFSEVRTAWEMIAAHESPAATTVTTTVKTKRTPENVRSRLRRGRPSIWIRFLVA
jgi:hypothetical protein